MASQGESTGSRSVQDLPVRILTDDELIGEYDRTFTMAGGPHSTGGLSLSGDERTMRRNAAAMGELLRRGYTSSAPVWAKPERA